MKNPFADPGLIEVDHLTDASVAQVMRVLADGWLYGLWVVGASHIRAVDDAWPAPGSRIHHAVGAWPALIRDHSESLEYDPAGSLVLRVRAWPVGEARVELTVRRQGGGSRIVIAEKATAGPGQLLGPAQRLVLPPRNREALCRLAVIAEGRRTRLPRPTAAYST